MLSKLFPPEVRKQKMKSYILWGLINFALIVYMMSFILIFWNECEWNEENNCIADLSWWVMVYLVIQVIHIVRKIIIVYIWKVANDPTIAQTKVDLIAIPFLVVPEIAWYIYGNTLVYRETEMALCMSHIKSDIFYWSVICLIIYGYIYILAFVLTILAAIAVFYYFKINSETPEETERIT